jgi:hypothetical protein
MAERILEEVPSAQREPLVIRDPRDGSAIIRSPRDDAGFVPLGRTGELAMITDTSGRSAPAHLVAAAKASSRRQGRKYRRSNWRSPPHMTSNCAANSWRTEPMAHPTRLRAVNGGLDLTPVDDAGSHAVG